MPATKARRDYYEVLGVSRDAEPDEIRKAYKKLARRYHPDHNKDPEAVERFKEVAEAYAILHDPEKRALYDRRGFAGTAGLSPDDLFGGMDFHDLFGPHGFGFNFDLGGNSVFDRFFGGRQRAGRSQGAHAVMQVEVPLDTIASGGEEDVRVVRTVRCETCNASGAAPGTESRTCTVCDGTGRRMTEQHRENLLMRQVSVCEECHGTGHIIDKPCPDCGGSGVRQQEETLTVKIPRGCPEGARLRIPGLGEPSPEPGGRAGDLQVVVRTKPDERFERRGDDLWRLATIGVAEAALGTRVEVPTLDGPVVVTVPPGTQPGAVLRVHDAGLPRFQSDGHGDIYVSVHVQVPRELSAKERSLYEQIRELEKRERR